MPENLSCHQRALHALHYKRIRFFEKKIRSIVQLQTFLWLLGQLKAVFSNFERGPFSSKKLVSPLPKITAISGEVLFVISRNF